MTKTPKNPGAFGKQPEVVVKQNKKRNLKINKYRPPVPVQERMISKDKHREHKNPIIRFFKKFFMGEGY